MYISIVLPTRNRPDCVKICLDSIVNQSYENFEVIISDNSTELFCDEIVEKYNDRRLKYFKTSKSLGICDSFEFAVNKAQGDWVMLLGDKNIMYRDALQKIVNALEETNPEILNFGQDYFSPFNKDENLLRGKLKKIERNEVLERVDMRKALESYLSYEFLMASVRKEWYLGSIYTGGVYSKSFLESIRVLHDSGRIFDGIVPDRYGAVEALCIAKDVYWLDDNIIIYNVCGKNTWGDVIKKQSEDVINFVAHSRSDKNGVDDLLIPGVFASVNNIVASDYHNAFFNARGTSKNVFSGIKEGIPFLLAVVENELESNRTIAEDILEKQKKLVLEYMETLNEDEMIELKKQRVKVLKLNRKKRYKTIIYNNIVKLINTEILPYSKFGIKVLKLVSRDTIITGGGVFRLLIHKNSLIYFANMQVKSA